MLPDGRQMAYLKDDRALKDHQHESGEEGVVPILIQAPERNAEHLEDKERSDSMFGEELGEPRDGDMALVRAVSRFQAGQRWQTAESLGRGIFGGDTSGRLEEGQGRGRIARVGNGSERVGLAWKGVSLNTMEMR